MCLVQVKAIVLGADDHKVEGAVGQEVHDPREYGTLEEGSTNRLAADELFFQDLAVHRCVPIGL